MLYIFDKDDKFLNIITEDTGLVDTWYKGYENHIPDESFIFHIDSKSELLNLIMEENLVAFYDRDNDLQLMRIKELYEHSSDEGYVVKVKCEPSYLELYDHFIEDRRFVDKTAQEALNGALQGSRYVGEVTVDLGLATDNFYWIDGIEAIWKILETWGGSLKHTITLNHKNEIVERKIWIVQRLGTDNGLIVEPNYNAEQIGRNSLSYVETALWAKGASLEADGTGHSKYITFADVEWKKSKGDPVDKPKGQKWVGDPQALAEHGYLHNGVRKHRFGHFSNQDYDDPEELLWATWNALLERKLKEITHEATIYESDKKVSLGDTVTILDRSYNKPIELQSQITGLEYDILDDKEVTIIVGKYIDMNEDPLQKEIDDLKNNVNKVASRPQKVSEGSYPDRKPSTPINVRIDAGIETIQLYWDYADEIFIKHYEVYGSQIKDFVPDSQHLLWRGQVSAFAHTVGTDQKWYYRIRAVNYHGTVSDWSVQVEAHTHRVITDDILFGSITKDLLADLSVDAQKLADMSVTGEKLVDDSITADKILDSAITNAKIAEDAVAAINIQNNAINNEKLVDLAINAEKLANGAITSDKIVDGTITEEKISNLSISADKLKDGIIDDAKLADLAVTAEKLVDSAVTAKKIANLAVGTAAIAGGAITRAKIQDLAVGNAAIANAAITNGKIANLAVSTGKIQDLAVTNGKIANLAIGTAAIQDLAVTNAKIYSLHADKISAGVIAAERIAIGPLSRFEDGYDPTKIEIGGRNLFEGGELSKYTGTGNNAEHMYYANINHALEKVNIGDTITISFDIKMVKGDRIQVYCSNRRGKLFFIPQRTFSNIGTDKVRLSFQTIVSRNTGTVHPDGTDIEFYSTYGTSDWFTVSNLQIERGNKATDWTPAPEDNPALLWRYRDTIYIDGGSIYANTITANEIATGTITAASGIIANGAITNAKIADAAITEAKIQKLAVGTAAIADLAVSRAKLQTAVVGTLQVEDGAITNAKIHSLNADKINAASLSAISANLGTVTAGILRSNNNNMNLNLNTGNLTMQSAMFTLGNGAEIEFTDPVNHIVYQRLDSEDGFNRTAGIGISNALNRRFPVVYMGTTGTGKGSFSMRDDNYFTGFIANTNRREAIDGIGNSVIGYTFHVRDKPLSYDKGFTFELRGNPTLRGINAHNHNYYLGNSNFLFHRLYVRGINTVGNFVIRNVVNTNIGWRLSTIQESGRVSLRGINGGSYNYDLGASESYNHFHFGYINNLRGASGASTSLGVSSNPYTYGHINTLTVHSNFWNNSLREYKENIVDLDLETALEFVRDNDIKVFNYKGSIVKTVGLIRDDLVGNVSLVANETAISPTSVQYINQKVLQNVLKETDSIKDEVNWLKMENQYLRQKIKMLEEKVA